ncbi:hypothetical protein TEA_015524 [Camellia sinensis var. sinensis]|uniref:Pectinesterase inhibitor domain-containing protein n=1 Tax=Camellia sinensis var. sinensis TaxID=542762 RepID=A0A4S4DZX6_CAMSN|nr:hypothetical protein TEA_015524 [Camellia sinensis var. sinensis]
MEDCMRECMRKLCLWVTRTFKPVMSHDELEPIMATLGFVGLPPSSAASGCDWKEYVYSAGGWRRSLSLTIIDHQNPPPPSPRLPYPRIDGLHIYTYTAFLDAVNFYLEMTNMSDLFHIRVGPVASLWSWGVFLSRFSLLGQPSELVSSICKNTTNYRFCVESLYSDPRTPTADSYVLAYVSFDLAYLNASHTEDYIDMLFNNTTADRDSRGMPLHRVLDRNRKWRRIEEDDSVFVYREGTLDQAIYTYYHKNKNDVNSGSKGCNSMLIRNKGNSTPTGCIVPLKDIIV